MPYSRHATEGHHARLRTALAQRGPLCLFEFTFQYFVSLNLNSFSLICNCPYILEVYNIQEAYATFCFLEKASTRGKKNESLL